MAASTRQSRRALTLIEAMILLVILSIITLGVGVSLQGLAKSPTGNDFQLAVNAAIVSKMEEVCSTNFASLTTGTAMSDTVTINGTSYARTVTIAQANPNGGGNVSSFLQITITVNGQTLVTLESQP